jgi:hypothetical protein
MKISLLNSGFQVLKTVREEAEQVNSQKETFLKLRHQFKIDQIFEK